MQHKASPLPNNMMLCGVMKLALVLYHKKLGNVTTVACCAWKSTFDFLIHRFPPLWCFCVILKSLKCTDILSLLVMSDVDIWNTRAQWHVSVWMVREKWIEVHHQNHLEQLIRVQANIKVHKWQVGPSVCTSARSKASMLHFHNWDPTVNPVWLMNQPTQLWAE